jgi:peptidoglycan/xylan/chitin deacetylase (PgdA/CDA1 family)
MKTPLHGLGYRFLTAAAEHRAGGVDLPQLTRRGFMLMAASLTSCAAAPPAAPAAGGPQVRTVPNAGYRTPQLRGPVPRNPDMAFGSEFGRNAGVSFTRVPVAGKYIAITFDDGPHPQNTPRLLNMLRARNIRATFYVIGRSVNQHPGIVRRTVAEGHEIGNHSQTHRLLSKLSSSELREEMTLCQNAIVNAAGVRPRTMRPPYGGLLQTQRELVLNEYGYPTILWSVDPLDWKKPGAAAISSRIIAGTNSGAIVLAHDLHSQTVDAMPNTLDTLLQRGYQFVTVSQLIAMKSAAVATVPQVGS